MPNDYFKFRKFTVQQGKCAMKVGTDGVLLGAWASINNPAEILDIGTGTGLVSLMLAQRFDARITAIEIDKNAYNQAADNFKNSPWHNKINLIHADFKMYKPDIKFNLIVCNPPYFVGSLKSPDISRTIARHTESLTFEDLLKGVSSLLLETGTFSVVIPTDVADQFIGIAERYNLYLNGRLNIKTAPTKQPKRCLLSMGFTKVEFDTDELLIEIERHKYSKEFTALVKDFYLNA